MKIQMNKLSRKLILRITLVLCIVFILSFAANTFLLPKYFFYQKKNKLADLSSHLATMEYSQILEQSKLMEMQYQVTIANVSLSNNLNEVNEQLKDQLNRKGITLSKFWLTEESIATLRKGGRVNIIYDQTKLKSSFLVNFLPIDNYVFAIGESISHSSDTIQIVNQFNAYIWFGALFLLTLFAILFTTRIVKPLSKLNETAEAISNLSFTKVDIKTGDEIESLALSINRMSDKLENVHQALELKNTNLRTFIADISHELKTPLSLIKVYASGIKDGLDDGSYADVIQQQSEEMAKMVDRLLELSRLQVEPYLYEPIHFRELFFETFNAYRIVFLQQGLSFEVDDSQLTEDWVTVDRRKLESVLNNLITNAMKYTTDNRISMSLENKGDFLRFSVANGADTEDEANWDLVWEPFYVKESSRSKKFSGTGLGLTITRTILENHHADFGLLAQNGVIEFYFSLPLLR